MKFMWISFLLVIWHSPIFDFYHLIDFYHILVDVSRDYDVFLSSVANAIVIATAIKES